jgi:hypothetical protein
MIEDRKPRKKRREHEQTPLPDAWPDEEREIPEGPGEDK